LSGLDAEFFSKHPPRTHRITKLGAAAYIGFLEWVSKRDGHTGCVHAAEVMHPTKGRMEVCVKMFNNAGRGHRGLINEVTGWLLASLLDVKQPATAMVISVPLDRLKPFGGPVIKDIPKGTTHWPAFCTERINAKGAAVEFENCLPPVLKAEIAQWSYLAHTISLDEFIGNADRHANNLLRLGPKDFAAIDHDRLACAAPGDSDWNVATLDRARQFDNQLFRKIGLTNNRIHHLMFSTIEHQTLNLREHMGELAYWAETLVQDKADRAAWLGFIEHRAWILIDLMRKRLGMLHGDLNDAPTPEKCAERYKNVITI
jgi:hypothetical protein